VMVWEGVAASGAPPGDAPHRRSAVLLASVKDSVRFDGGWGFFDFTGADGRVAATADAQPESSGCRTCHRRDGATDHVFTQFYPGLRSVGRGGGDAARRPGSAALSDPSA